MAVLTVLTPPFVTGVESFETGWEGWYTDNAAIWQVGRPTSGPGNAHSGTNCAATVLGGDYPDDANARLVSPAFVVPTDSPRLRFWHWWSFSGGDWGQVQIRVGTSNWVALSGGYSGNSDGYWSRASLDLSAYAGQTVQLGLYFESHGYDDVWGHHWNTSSGWYVDDLTIETGPLPVFALPSPTLLLSKFSLM